MKTLHSAILVSLLAMGANTFANAANDIEPKKRQHKNPLHHLFDTNQDGVIDSSEIQNAGTSLDKLDKNQDGQIDKEDFKLIKEEKKAERAENGETNKPGKHRFATKHCKGGKHGKFAGKHAKFDSKDVNKDGMLDSSEVDEKFIERFDTDQDGLVSKSEIKQTIKAKLESRKAE
ncbi:hypothetical protein [Catenovulum maritimum]|uniref:EF-hand domain-containing protein n=1 Tax=Catenovulum maritimum TaxID=1513271 RepID=A0A0J8GW15_9ALTE|nr:hypothetical protein [Catenovulum maritimum]KMT66970.1 hypothetical protein XM47_02430 [Catenovulum maritimum]